MSVAVVTATVSATAAATPSLGFEQGRSDRSTARAPSAHRHAKSTRKRKRCRKGYKKVRTKRGRLVCKRKRKRHQTPSSVPTAPPAVPSSPPNSGTDLGQQILDDTYELTVRLGEEFINGSHGPLPHWYKYEVNRSDCVLLSGDTGRCLIYLWQLTYASGYGYGGYESGIWREYYIATRVGDRLYEPKIVQIDFDYPFAWVCSDDPSQGVAPCT